jgi:pSer/pThr/pTyr-binding forkhead associated (FHA) protein
MVRLVISDNEGSTTVVPLLRDEISIGRKEGNTIRLTERNISRQHAHLVRVNSVYKLRDLDSYNGVLINGRRVQGESDVTTGDQIQIGDYTILVEEEAAKAALTPGAEAVDPGVAKRPATPARLVMLSDPSPGAEFALPADRHAKLGRSEDIDCPINHRSVSREHAEIKSDNGLYVICDLDSANGLTVNGQPVREHALEAGDIVELGQVGFRFVAPGEHYFFDEAEAARYRRKFSGANRANLRLAAIVLGAACVVAAVVVMSGRNASVEETTTPISTGAAVAATGAVGASPTTLADDGYDKALSACQAALGGSRFAEALAHAALALKVRPNASAASECKDQAQAQYEDEQAYVRGKAALQVGDFDAAFQEFSRFSASSPFRSRPEVAEATAQLARARLTRARGLLGTEPGEALRLVQGVLAMPDLPRALAGVAEQLLSDARRQAVAVEAAPVARAAPGRSSPSRAPAAARAPAPSAQSAMDVASACLARGDNGCVIRALANRASTAQELGLLIETYRATGDTKQAQKSMVVYVKRFPTARRADAYRRMLELQGQ